MVEVFVLVLVLNAMVLVLENRYSKTADFH